MKQSTTILLLLILFISTTYAQGQLFSKPEADNKFGQVIKKVRINSHALRNFLDGKEHLMFAIDKVSQRINILKSNKSPILSQFPISKDDTYHLYETQKITELLYYGGENETYIEQREDVVSISNGEYVLELAVPCPPCCPRCPDWPDWPEDDY